MAWEFKVFDIPALISSVDLSGTTGSTNGYGSTAQYLFAKLTAADTIAPCAALTDFPVGVIQNNAKKTSTDSNVGAEVRQLGVTKVVGAAALTVGTMVGPDANGRAVARVLTSGGGDATHWVAGVVLEATGALGELATVLLLSPFILQA